MLINKRVGWRPEYSHCNFRLSVGDPGGSTSDGSLGRSRELDENVDGEIKKDDDKDYHFFIVYVRQ